MKEKSGNRQRRREDRVGKGEKQHCHMHAGRGILSEDITNFKRFKTHQSVGSLVANSQCGIAKFREIIANKCSLMYLMTITMKVISIAHW